MKLYGTVTSPFVRRVRVVAHELEVPVEVVDTSTPEGQATLRAVTPIAKVPVAELAGEVVFDSRTIIEQLHRRHGHGRLRVTSRAVEVAEANLVNALDEALGAAIRVFYVKRDGGDPAAIPYLAKERDRVGAVMRWVEAQVDGPWATKEPGFGRAEIALVSALGWMRFRAVYPVEAHPKLVALEQAHADRPSIALTAPG